MLKPEDLVYVPACDRPTGIDLGRVVTVMQPVKNVNQSDDDTSSHIVCVTPVRFTGPNRPMVWVNSSLLRSAE